MKYPFTKSADCVRGCSVTLHDELEKEFSKVISRFDCDEIILTPFFNLGKNIPEILQQYKRFEKRKNRFFYTSYKFKYIFRLVLLISRILVHHVYWLSNYKKYLLKIPKDSKLVFLSHFTGAFNQLNESDRYFGEIITKRKIQKEKTLMLLINHTRKAPKYQHKSNLLNESMYLILPKTTNTIRVWRIFVKQFQNFIYILRLSRKHGTFHKDDRIFMYELAIQQLSQSTLSQQILFSNLSDMIAKVSLEELNLTYEGHTYETYLARKIQGKYSKILINVYQFAPVVPSQVSFFENLKLLPREVKINLTGPSILEQIVRRTDINPNRLEVVGSSKNRNISNFNSRSKSEKLTVLFAPEGSFNSFSEFASLADYCASRLHDMNFIIRPHPISRKYQRKIMKEYLGKCSNLTLSASSLESDLNICQICIYRSSAVGIEGMQYGVIPIHYSNLLKGDIDPIRFEDLIHARINCPESLIQVLNNFRAESSEKIWKSRVVLPKVFKKYFAPFGTK
jgi:hypothetical protein